VHQTSTVPVIVVFTQYDLLVGAKRNAMRQEGEKDKQVLKLKSRQAAERDFQALCITPLRQFLGKRPIPPYIKVSEVKRQYEDTLLELIDLTRKHITEVAATFACTDREPVSIMMAIAQGVDPSHKVDASIIVGQKKYWRGMASSAQFPGFSLASCLHVLHKDVVKVWNFHDVDSYLVSPGFEAAISLLVNESAGPHVVRGNKSLTTGAAMLSGLVGAVAPIVAPITVPSVFLGLVFAKWAYETYRKTPHTLRCLMGYIIHLTNMMQGIFQRIEGSSDGPRSVSKEITDSVVEAYKTSTILPHIHDKIQVFAASSKVWEITDKDYVLDEIIRLIKEYPFILSSQNERGH